MQVYDNNSAAVKIPKHICGDSNMLLLGFPDCGSSYFLLMQLDKDFKPQFKLLETSVDASARGHSLGDLNHVTFMKKIDMDKMQMLEDEMDFSLLDWGKLQTLLPNAEGLNQTIEHGLVSELALDGSGQSLGGTMSSFSSVVDEVFDLEKGASLPPLSVQSFSTSASQYSSGTLNPHSIKAGTAPPSWDVGMPISQVNSTSRVPNSSPHYGGPSYNARGLAQSVAPLSSGPGRAGTARRMSTSKSDQDLSSLDTFTDEDQLRFQNDPSNGNRSSWMLSPPISAGTRVAIPSGKSTGPRAAPNGALGALRSYGSSSWISSPLCKTPQLTFQFINYVFSF